MMRLFFVCGADFLCAVGLQTCGSPTAQAGLFRGGQVQGEAVASRL
ncbi:hypothetical protein ECC34666_5332 [Escherichia coli C-34666]|nr:hypothetical protein ECMP02155212_5817 [Escherichia coli MP021552.12]EMV28357.1 hypothetical protein ECC34666_5332 [Escherichia coli C-34666]KEL88522.1 hypothetical protein AC62_5551 [Escherichia coli 6-175-07_S3_C3]KEM35011.1 hypothetical protein AC38_5595 [Escherichia coli 6-319-05_S3_C2]KEM56288.1 hypothetical protein AC63_5126 [Escherichia coli 6-319-05_S3_C3]